jgi:hypothetical protein
LPERVYSVSLTANNRGYNAALDQSAAKTIQFGRTVERAGDQASHGFSRSSVSAALMSGSLQRVAETATGFFAGQVFIQGAQKIARGLGSIAIAGSDLNEQLSATGATFGPAAAAVVNSANQMGKTFGTNKVTFLEAANGLGGITKAAGLTAPAAAQMSTQFVKLAADLSSFKNVSFDEALQSIRSGLVGEAEPLRRFGVLLSEDAVKQEALSLGLSNGTGQLNEQQKVMARASLITKQLSDAHGDLERTSGGLANRLRAIQGGLSNFAADVGLKAQPAILDLLDFLGRLGSEGIDAFQQLQVALTPFGQGLAETFQNLGPIISSIGQAVGPVASAFAQLAGGPIIGALNVLAQALGGISGFLAENAVIVKALAAVYIASLLPALAQTVAGLGNMALSLGALGFEAVATRVSTVAAAFSTVGPTVAAAGEQLTLFGAEAAGTATQLALFEAESAGAVTSTSRFGAGLSALGGALSGLAIPAAVFGFIQLQQHAAAAKRKNDELTQSIIAQARANKDLSSDTGLSHYIRDLNEAIALQRQRVEEENKHERGGGGLLNRIEAGVRNRIADPSRIFESGSRTTEADRLKTLQKELDNTGGKYRSFISQVALVERATGASSDEVLKAASVLGIDFTKATADSVTQTIAFIKAEHEKAAASEATAAQLKAEKDAQDALSNATASTFQGISSRGFDELVASKRETGGAKGKTAADREIQLEQARLGVKDATHSLADAEEKLSDARAALASGADISEKELKLEHARIGSERSALNLASAEKKLADLRAGPKATELTSGEISVTQAQLGSERAAKSVADAQKKLNEERAKDPSRAVADAEMSLAQAQLGTQRAAISVARAQEHLNQLRNADPTRPVVDAEIKLSQAMFGTERAAISVYRAQQRLEDLRRVSVTRVLAEAELKLSDAMIGTERAALRVADAQEQLFLAQDHGTPRDLTEANLNLREALNSQQQAAFSAEDAQNGLNDARNNNHALDIAEAELSLNEALLAQQQAALGLTDAQNGLNSARTANTALDLQEAELALQEAMLGQQSAAFGLTDAQAGLNTARQVDSAAGIQEAEFALREALLGQVSAQNELITSQERLNELRAGAKPEDIAAAELDVRDARAAQKDATNSLTTAEDELTRARSPQSEAIRAVEDAERALETAKLSVKQASNDLTNAETEEQGGHSKTSTSLAELGISYDEIVAKLRENIAHHQEFASNLQHIADEQFPEFAQKLGAMGEKGEAIAASLKDKGSADIRTMFELMLQDESFSTAEFARVMDAKFGESASYVATHMDEMSRNLAQTLGITVEQAKTLLADWLKGVQGAVDDFISKNVYKPGVDIATAGGQGTPTVGGGKIGNAAGNLYESHVAQMGAGDVIRVWNEPETQGEAYIPFANDWRRPRAQAIWTETGKRIGMFAGGGMNLPNDPDFSNYYWWLQQTGNQSVGKTKASIAEMSAAFLAAQESTRAAAAVPSAVTGGGSSDVPEDVSRNAPLASSGGRGTQGEFAGPAAMEAKVNPAFRQRGWGDGDQWGATRYIVYHESSWDPESLNSSSGAFGLFQFLDSTWAGTGIARSHDAAQQAEAGARYIKNRYTDPLGAESFWRKNHWYGAGGFHALPAHSYDNGGYLPTGYSLAHNGTGRPEPVGGGARTISVTVSPGAVQFSSEVGTVGDLDQFENRMQSIAENVSVVLADTLVDQIDQALGGS